MGINSQSSVPKFTAGEVLTAANMNISAGTGVPVFDTTTQRDAAFGGTGEKVLAEGQLCYVENLTGDAQIQYYDGSAWNSLGAAGLTLISSTTIGTAVSSVTVSNAFSATYDNYKIIVSGGAGSFSPAGMAIQIGNATTGYYNIIQQLNFNGSASNASAQNAANFDGIGGISTTSMNANIELLSPFLTENTFIMATRAVPDTTSVAGLLVGFLNNTTSYTSFTISSSTGTMTGGTIKVYGYRN